MMATTNSIPVALGPLGATPRCLEPAGPSWRIRQALASAARRCIHIRGHRAGCVTL
jgi:hypothetical protein